MKKIDGQKLAAMGTLSTALLLMFQACGTPLDLGSSSSPTSNATISFTPSSGPIGTLLQLSGIDFTSTTAASVNGVAAAPLSSSSTSLTALVMPGSTSGTLSVTTAAGTYTSNSSFTVTASGAPANQQGIKLVGTGNVGNSYQGGSVALSADGNTAIVGGPNDNGLAGAAWVYTRSGTTWSQQGNKLVGTGNVGAARQGASVALSADGNTAIVAGYGDNGGVGAAWVFTRSGTTWSQQGNKLVGTGNVGASGQGQSVALSANGNTAIVAGYGDNANVGAAWIFTRSGTTWSQQGNKLVGTGYTGTPWQGRAVALSGDGNTAIVGGYKDDTVVGAAWVFTRSGTTWSQQGDKLVGTGITGGSANQGQAVALNADGNTAIVGGYGDNGGVGAAWVFTRSGTAWSQQGNKLVGTGTAVGSREGFSAALSADGNTAIIGGFGDNTNVGATWVFTRSGTTWNQSGNKLVGTGYVGMSQQGASVALSADGSTAIVGGNGDSGFLGAAWVFAP